MTSENVLEQVLYAYRRAVRRILFLDYDGTLVPFNDDPEKSGMGEEVRGTIAALTEDPQNTLYIISGRNTEFLDRQFRGIRIGLIAEHGFLKREVGRQWVVSGRSDVGWKSAAVDLFAKSSAKYPGTFTEEKKFSVAFHYRLVASYAVERIKTEVRERYDEFRKKNPGLELLDGNKVLEIKPISYNKGLAAQEVLEKGTFDFILAAGDDLTDESLFGGIPGSAYTIKIGAPPTHARFNISDHQELITFLKELIILK